jgi:hypothetical protein
VQKRIGITGGMGPGQAALPDTLSSGIYMIRAYTNWMKNFMPDNCFSKNIIVFNPLKSRSFNNTGVKAESPAIHVTGLQQSGLALNVMREGNRNALIEITSSPEYRSAKGVTHYLSVQTRGTMNFTSPVSITGDKTIIEIPGNLISPGINQITLFNISGRPVCEKYICTPFDEAAMEISSEGSYSIREKVTSTFKAESGSPYAANDLKASVSVVPAGGESFPDIADYLVFGSEFGALPEELLHSELNEIYGDTLDDILGSLKSNWIDWETILSGKSPAITYKKETAYHFLYGRLLNRSTQKPDSGQFVFLSIPGKNAYFQYALTDKKGEFSLTLPID